MFKLQLETNISAAHQIEGHQGKCRFMHGHNWRISVTFEHQDGSWLLSQKPMFLEILDSVGEKYDHKNLNDLPPFQNLNSTAENISKILFKDMQALLPEADILHTVDVWETPKYSASYTEFS